MTSWKPQEETEDGQDRTGRLTVQLSWEKPSHFKQALVLLDSPQGETEGTVQAWLWLTQIFGRALPYPTGCDDGILKHTAAQLAAQLHGRLLCKHQGLLQGTQRDTHSLG